MPTLSMEIDLELYKAIERHRCALDESQEDIIRRVMISGREFLISPFAEQAIDAPGRVRLARRGGNYRVVILGKSLEAQSLKEVLKQAILHADSTTPGFIEKLAAHRTLRGRRIVARKAEELYPGKPQLVTNCAEKLDQKWWYDTNISYAQCQRYLQILGQIGGFPEPRLEQ